MILTDGAFSESPVYHQRRQTWNLQYTVSTSVSKNKQDYKLCSWRTNSRATFFA